MVDKPQMHDSKMSRILAHVYTPKKPKRPYTHRGREGRRTLLPMCTEGIDDQGRTDWIENSSPPPANYLQRTEDPGELSAEFLPSLCPMHTMYYS
jgi:hypothetical protein